MNTRSADTRPLAFIDVDGVLNRFASRSAAKKLGYSRHHIGRYGGFPVDILIDHNDVKLFAQLSEVFELAWGSWWGDKANREICPLYGMEPFEVVARPDPIADAVKAPVIIDTAQGRDFVWFDDDFAHEGLDIISTYTGSSALAVPVDAPIVTMETLDTPTGLTQHHVDTALDWAHSLGY